MKYNRIYVTNHAIERFFERINSERLKNNEVSVDIKMDRKEIESKIRHMVLTGTPERSFLNDQVFLGRMYEKFGYDKKIDFVYNSECNLVFLLLIEKNTVCKVITTLSKKMAKVNQSKFNHVEKKVKTFTMRGL